MESGRLIDSTLTQQDRPVLGIKYSCFDDLKKQNRVQGPAIRDPTIYRPAYADPGA